MAYLDVSSLSTLLGLGRSPFSHVTSVRDFSTRALPSPYCPQASTFSQGLLNHNLRMMCESTPLGLGRSPFSQYYPHVSTLRSPCYCPQASTFSQGLGKHDVRMMCKSKKSASEVQEVDVPDKIMLKQIWTEVRNLTAKVDNAAKQLQGVDRKVAGLSEASMRAFGATLFGASFAKRHLALKLEDLVFLVAKGKDSKLKSDDLKQILAAARVMAEALEPSIQPLIDRLIAVMREDPEVAKKKLCVKDLDEAKSAVDANDLKRAVEKMIKVASLTKKEQWKKFLVRLKKAVVSSTDCIDELLSCGGPGIMLAGLMSKAMMWRSAGKDRKSTSIQDYLLEVKNPFTEFSEEVEFDMRGTILLVSPHVTVAVGEIKSSVSHLSQAKAQLSYRCALLRWTVKTVLPSRKYKDYTMIGHIFVPRLSLDKDRDAEVDSDGISYYVHRVD